MFREAFDCLGLSWGDSAVAFVLDLVGHAKHNLLKAAYSYWNVATTVPLQVRLRAPCQGAD